METKLIYLILSVFGLSYEAVFITGRKCRKRELVICRQTIHYFIHKKTKFTLNEIGNLAGRKDHATVLHSIKSIKAIKSTNFRPYSDYIKYILSQINYSYWDYITDINKPIKIKYPKIDTKNYIFYEHSTL